MDKALRDVNGKGWDEWVQERVGKPLCPKFTQSVLIIAPGASGDVVLNTTLVRHIKAVNPGCFISFATKRVNIPLVNMCPGIDQIVELPDEPLAVLSRQRHLKMFEGSADAVVYTQCFPEDIDLLTDSDFDLLQSIWLLAGEPLDSRQKLWIETSADSPNALTVLSRVLGPQTRKGLAEKGAARVRESLSAFIKSRSFKGSRVRTLPSDLLRVWGAAVETSKPIHTRRLRKAAVSRDFVLLGSQSNSLPGPPEGFVDTLVRMLQGDGRTVLHNVLSPCDAAPGTVPLICSYEEFICLRQSGIPFVGWRSGLCDIAAVAPAPMAVFYPPGDDFFASPLKTFGFGSMNIAADCLELVCRSVSDVVQSNLVPHLKRGRGVTAPS